MNKTLIKCAFVGGIIVFIWGMASWMVLPWHKMAMNKFTNEQKVAEVIRENAHVDGIYILPNKYKIAGSPEEKQKQTAQDNEMLEKGPVMFSSICLQGIDGRGIRPFIISIIINFVAAYVITWMLMQTKAMSYRKSVGFITLVGVLAALLGDLPQWNWMGVAGNYIFICIFDHVIGWFLGGLAIAKICKR